MTSRGNQPWIPVAKIEELVQLEPALVFVGLAMIAWLFYKIFLSQVSEERHRNLRNLFRNLAFHMTLGTMSYLAYSLLHSIGGTTDFLDHLTPYVGLAALVFGAVAFVKICRILLFEYLFLSHMTVAVPLLLVNLFTLLLTILLFAWGATEIFAFRLAPVLATSAIFSLVLGLALQDTLGNLFAGVALQFDKPYEIGDWIEVQPGNGQKWTGQVQEISWRATVLQGFGDEAITIPNRTMAQAQVSNFATRHHPVIRSQILRFAYGTSIEKVRATLIPAAKAASGVRHNPPPLVLAWEAGESWMAIKLIYYIDHFGEQYLIADRVLENAIQKAEQAGLEFAPPRLAILRETPAGSP